MADQLPALVLLPGMDGTGELFAPLLAALGGRFETIIVRYPLHEPCDYAGLLPIARAALPGDRPFMIVAESFSGPIGISLAAEAPSGLRGLVLCSTFARNPRPALANAARWLQAVPMHGALVRLGAAAMLGSSASPELRAMVERTVQQIPSDVLRARLRAVLQVDVTRELASVIAPVLYLQATSDLAVPSSAAKVIRRIKPGANVVRIDGPHFLLQVRPDDVAGEIARLAISTPAS